MVAVCVQGGVQRSSATSDGTQGRLLQVTGGIARPSRSPRKVGWDFIERVTMPLCRWSVNISCVNIIRLMVNECNLMMQPLLSSGVTFSGDTSSSAPTTRCVSVHSCVFFLTCFCRYFFQLLHACTSVSTQDVILKLHRIQVLDEGGGWRPARESHTLWGQRRVQSPRWLSGRYGEYNQVHQHGRLQTDK